MGLPCGLPPLHPEECGLGNPVCALGEWSKGGHCLGLATETCTRRNSEVGTHRLGVTQNMPELPGPLGLRLAARWCHEWEQEAHLDPRGWKRDSQHNKAGRPESSSCPVGPSGLALLHWGLSVTPSPISVLVCMLRTPKPSLGASSLPI